VLWCAVMTPAGRRPRPGREAGPGGGADAVQDIVHRCSGHRLGSRSARAARSSGAAGSCQRGAGGVDPLRWWRVRRLW
jgi:hypothetical protein